MENKAISSDLIRGHIDTIILYSLLDGQKTSQQIIDSVLYKSENKYQLNQATLYSSLKRLESLKLISSFWRDADGDGRRKFFTLTENGKNTVSANLSNWEYSRAIIDKLIGFKDNSYSTNKTHIVEVEKIVEKPVYVEKVIEKSAEKNSDMKNDYPEKPSAEINFRNILNGLIKTNEKQKTEKAETPIADNSDSSAVKNFNETINVSIKDVPLTTSNKIDFSDLKEKVEADGYKLSISSKDNKIKKGSLFINKINLFSALSITLLALIEFLVFAVSVKNSLTFSPLAVILAIALIALFPIVLTVIYLKNPYKTSFIVKKDSILYAAIIAFNLILFTIVLDLLFDVNFDDTLMLSLYLIMPILLVADMVLFFVIRFYISKINIFINKKN